MPEKLMDLKVGGVTFDVVFDESLASEPSKNGGGLRGQVDGTALRIELDPGQPAARIAETLTHEIMHICVAFVLGWTSPRLPKLENYVGSVARQLFAVLLTQPEIRDGIPETLTIAGLTHRVLQMAGNVSPDEATQYRQWLLSHKLELRLSLELAPAVRHLGFWELMLVSCAYAVERSDEFEEKTIAPWLYAIYRDNPHAMPGEVIALVQRRQVAQAQLARPGRG